MNTKSTADMGNYNDLEKVIKMLFAKRDYVTLLIAIKKSQVILTESQQAVVDDYKERAEKAMEESRQRIKMREEEKKVSGKFRIRMRALKRAISNSRSEGDIEKNLKEAQDEIKNVENKMPDNEINILQAEVSFLAGWAMENKNPLKAIEVFKNSYERVGHGTPVAAMLSSGIAECYLLLFNQAMFSKDLSVYADRKKYKELMEVSESVRNEEFKAWAESAGREISNEKSMREIASTWRRKLLS